jgi:hypothetical protein
MPDHPPPIASSPPRSRQRILWAVVLLETALLVLTFAANAGVSATAAQLGFGSAPLVLLVLALAIGIGALARSLAGAIFLATTPYMLAIGLNAFTAWLAPAWQPVLQAMFSGGLLPGSPINGLLPLAAFGFLGWLGWLAGGRQAAPHH